MTTREMKILSKLYQNCTHETKYTIYSQQLGSKVTVICAS